jgi:hypothetical protein
MNKLSIHEAYNKILAEIVVVYDNFKVKEIESNVVTINGPDAEIGDSYENDDISSVSSDFEHELSLDFFQFFDSEVVSFNQSQVNQSKDDQSQVNQSKDDQSQVNQSKDDQSKVKRTNEIIERFTIEHQSIVELKEKFSSLVQNLEKNCIIITGLNKYSRKVLHLQCESSKLFHWSKQVDDNNSDLYVSDRDEDKTFHDKAQKMFFKKNKTVEERLIEINENLSSLDLSKKAPRQLVALQIERDALQMPQSWQATNDYIDNILETRSQAEQAEKIKKPRGRPRKVKTN